MSAVHQHDELNRLWPAEFEQRIERRADGPPGIEHIVDQQDALVVDGELDVGVAHDRLRADGVAHQVVAIERDVERPDRHLGAADAGHQRGQAPRERHTAPLDADERQFLDAARPLEDLVGNARQRATDPIRIEHYRHAGTCLSGSRSMPLGASRFGHQHLFATSQGHVKEDLGEYTRIAIGILR